MIVIMNSWTVMLLITVWYYYIAPWCGWQYDSINFSFTQSIHLAALHTLYNLGPRNKEMAPYPENKGPWCYYAPTRTHFIHVQWQSEKCSMIALHLLSRLRKFRQWLATLERERDDDGGAIERLSVPNDSHIFPLRKSPHSPHTNTIELFMRN